MKKFKNLLFSFSDLFESNENVIYIRKGLTASTPIIIIGAMALMLSSLPIPIYQSFLNSVFGGRLIPILLLIYGASFNMLSLFILTVISYLYTYSFTQSSNESISVSLISIAGYATMNGDILSGNAAADFGTAHFFSAAICAIITVNIYRFLRNNFTSRHSFRTLNSDSGFNNAIKTIFPALIIILFFVVINLIITYLFHVQSLQELLTKLCLFFFSHINSEYLSLLLYTFLSHLLWCFGIHGDNVMASIIQGNYIETGDNIFSGSFYIAFINMGGAGVCLCVIIAILLFSKTRSVRYVTKVGVLPALFNISEIISLGLPLIFNPVFFIPFLLTPMINGTISYLCMYFHLIPLATEPVTWTTPVLFSGYYATGSIAGAVLQIVLLIIGTACYMPFVRLYDERLKIQADKRVKELIQYMEDCEKAKTEPCFLTRNDTMGQTAKLLCDELCQAFDNNEIYFKYQPQIDNDGKCIGCEALVRWNHPNIGVIYPPLIIQLFKECDRLKDFDAFLMQNACELVKDIEEKFHTTTKVSINLSMASLSTNNVEDMMRHALHRYGVSASSIWIELTENEALFKSQKAVTVLHNLREEGHKILIDDFGMGHTSLKYLRSNDFDLVKLDRSLTEDIEINEINQKIIRSICDLGKSLNFGIVAEFVESKDQKDILATLGCEYYQGYLYSPAVEKEAYLAFFEKHNIALLYKN